MKVRGIALSSLFGIVIFSQKLLLPAPYDKIVSVLIQITLLSLAFLAVGFAGPILTGVISGLLTASMRAEFAVMTFTFALIFGVLVSILCRILHVAEGGGINRARLMTASLLSTVIVGLLSSGSSIALGIMPNNLFLTLTIIAAGAIQGLLGGYVTSVVYQKYLRGTNFLL